MQGWSTTKNVSIRCNKIITKVQKKEVNKNHWKIFY